MDDDDRTLISSIVIPKAADVLALRLRRMILSGDMPPGYALPNERELMSKSGLGRSTVREALRVLVAEGLVITKSGRNGGSVVAAPDRDVIRRSVESFVRINQLDFRSMVECCAAAEPTLAGLAAAKRTDEEARELQGLHEEFAARIDDLDAYRQLDHDWHLAVARASGNAPLIAMVEAVSPIILNSPQLQHNATADMRRQYLRTHADVQEAIMSRDSDGAFASMGRHLGDFLTTLDAGSSPNLA